jgi:deazaflavin-dependent oxidoreductase (nitroreductase family)
MAPSQHLPETQQARLYTRVMPLPKALARFHRRVTNRSLGALSGKIPPFATVVHRGRISGVEHRTPVWAFRTEGGFVIALTYGPDSDWVGNVLAAESCRLETARGSYDLVTPELLSGRAGAKLMPWVVRLPLRLLGVDHFLVMEHG